MEKWLSIDFGERRIGFAIALKETGLAFPRPFFGYQGK
jgi:RNase H-fold protein (predicted Holliday junction resolvase)